MSFALVVSDIMAFDSAFCHVTETILMYVMCPKITPYCESRLAVKILPNKEVNIGRLGKEYFLVLHASVIHRYNLYFPNGF